jgi:hypothetical protein
VARTVADPVAWRHPRSPVGDGDAHALVDGLDSDIEVDATIVSVAVLNGVLYHRLEDEAGNRCR